MFVCFSNKGNKSEKTDVLLFFREYCNDVKKSENNTEFLLNFNEFIDRNTPSSPSCKYSQTTGIFLRKILTYKLQLVKTTAFMPTSHDFGFYLG